MAEFKTVVKNIKRICDSYKVCEGCPLAKDGGICSRFMIEYPEKAEHIIMQWAARHPIKTNRMRFKEVFGYNSFAECPVGWSDMEYKGGQDENN